jgi:hypothetical protein
MLASYQENDLNNPKCLIINSDTSFFFLLHDTTNERMRCFRQTTSDNDHRENMCLSLALRDFQRRYSKNKLKQKEKYILFIFKP